ncbi:signal peptide peptidase-like 2A isoform X2 [Argiope bruennichi]|nr:signal peptide peptidase-like 2A isoform X2 [Argiope bruennichi]
MFNLCRAYHYVVMRAESTTRSNDFCVYSEIDPSLPQQAAEAKPHTLEIKDAVDWCTNNSKNNASDKVLLLPAGDCSLSDQIQNFYHMGGEVILFINNGSLNDMNFSEYKYLNGTGIPAMKISENSANVLKEMGKIITVQLFKPHDDQGLYIVVVLGALALFTVAAGSYMSGLTSYKIFKESITKKDRASGRGPKMHRNDARQNRRFKKEQLLKNLANKMEYGEEYGIPILILTPCYTVYLIVGLVITIVLGYLLKKYLLIFSLVSFTSGSIICLYFCLYSWTRKYKSYFVKYAFVFCNRKIVFTALSLILQTVSFGIPILWVIFRNAKYAWMLQNILSIFLCFGLLRLFRLSSLKMCSILLVLLFILDIFFVIVTPLFTKNGKSVMGDLATGGNFEKLDDANFMEEVAAGRKHIEFIPSLMQVKDIGFDDLGVCHQRWTGLGLGDIIMPGLLLSYCYAFDLCFVKKMIYYPISVILYGIGLSLSTISLIFWNAEQPALLYIVPPLLIPIMLLGWYRGELSTLWYGLKVIKAHIRKENSNNDQDSWDIKLSLDDQAEAT